MSGLDSAIKDLVQAFKEFNKNKTSPYDTQAEVKRVEGNIAWVHIPGGIDETPVRMTVNAEVGDNVQVRVFNGDAFLVGNGTAPPTDDRKANQAIASIKPVADAAEESQNLLGEMKTAAEEAGTTLTQIYQDAVDAKEASEEAQGSARQAAASASSAEASASSAAADASSAATSANAAGVSASQAQAASEAAQLAALSSITTDTLHYLATSQASGVTTQTAGWTTTVQTMTSTDKYLWTYHTYTAANGTSVDSTPVITGTFGEKGADGTSVTILGSYNSLAELEAAHPTGSLGDSYMVGGDLYVWNGTAWQNVGQIKGDKGDTGAQGAQGEQGAQGAKGDTGNGIASIQKTSTSGLVDTYTITYTDGTTRTYTVTNGEDGDNGADGNTIWTTTVAPTTPNYTFNNSNLSGSSGQTPKVGDIIIYSYYCYAITSVASTTVKATSRVSIRGAQGATGNAGISVTAVQPQYYLSTSSSSATGGSWSNSLSYVTGKYIWTRDRITYSNNTTGYSTAIYNSALTDACKDAAEALGLIEEHQEWFWHDTLGAHVLGAASGYRNDISSTGMKIMDITGLTEVSVAEFGADGAQIGQDGGPHSVIDTNGQRFYASDGTTQLANIGYGEGRAESGIAIAPYYTFGTRASGNIGNYSVAEGSEVIASGFVSHVEGYNTIASGYSSHAEGHGAKAIDYCSHAEGANTYSKGKGAHAEGYTTTSETIDGVSVGFIRAMADGAHAEGCATHSNTSAKIVASGLGAHAEGYSVEHSIYAEGKGAHAEGGSTGAYGDYSHAQNYCTEAYSDYQTTLGKYNVTDHNNTYAVIIGNGTARNALSNALMVDWNGDIYPQATKMADFIVDQGTDGMWTYRKWNSGIAECWGRATVASHTYAANGGYYNVTGAPPTGLFVSGSNPVLSATGGITSNVQTDIGFTFASDVNIQTYLINRNTSAITNTAWVCWHLIGRWK